MELKFISEIYPLILFSINQSFYMFESIFVHFMPYLDIENGFQFKDQII